MKGSISHSTHSKPSPRRWHLSAQVRDESTMIRNHSCAYGALVAARQGLWHSSCLRRSLIICTPVGARVQAGALSQILSSRGPAAGSSSYGYRVPTWRLGHAWLESSHVWAARSRGFKRNLNSKLIYACQRFGDVVTRPRCHFEAQFPGVYRLRHTGGVVEAGNYISRSVVFSSELTATMVLMSERIPCRYHLAVSAFHGTAPILTSFGRDCELHMLEVAEYGPGHHNRPSAKMRRHPSPQTCSSATRTREAGTEKAFFCAFGGRAKIVRAPRTRPPQRPILGCIEEEADCVEGLRGSSTLVVRR